MNKVDIREATESDLGTIDKLAKELIQSVENREGITDDVVSKNCRTLLDTPNSYILLAEINGKGVGFISITIRKTIIHSGLSGLVDEFIVSKDHRGKGLGKELIDAAVGKCRKLGCCEVEVGTEFANNNAREFYKRYGFKERGVLLQKDLL